MTLPSEISGAPVYLPSPTSTSAADSSDPPYYQGPAAPGGSDGPALDAELLGDGYIPQGQGYDGESTLLGTYNNGEHVRLTLQDRYSGEDGGRVTLGGEAAPPYPSTEGLSPQGAKTVIDSYDRALSQLAGPPTKGGGVATDGEYIYVADTDEVYVYSRREVESAPRDATVDALRVITLPDDLDVNASFLNIHEGKLYVGQWTATADAYTNAISIRGEGFGEQLRDQFEAINPFDGGWKDYLSDRGDALSPVEIDIDLDEPEMLVFDISDRNGNPTGEFDPASPVARHTIPFDAQGVTVTDNGFLFTRSHGSTELDIHYQGIHITTIHSPRELVFQPFDGGEARKVADIDYYAEGLNIVGDEVWITYESNANKYKQKYEDNTGHPPTNDHIQRIPLDSLDISRDDLGA